MTTLTTPPTTEATRVALDDRGAVEWPLWTTTVRLVVTDPGRLPEARRLVTEQLAAVELAASRFRPDSEVCALARSPRATHDVSPLLADLVRVALQSAAATDGAVDPTLGALLVELGYDGDLAFPPPDAAGPAVPARASGARTPVTLRRRAAWRDVTLHGRALTMPPGTLLDLGATAKAYAADRCATAVSERLDCGAMVSLGGDLRVAGAAPEGGWGVLVQDGPGEPACQVRLSGVHAVATSSTLHRTWRQGAQRMHHVVDPSTCRPAEPVWRTVTVAAPTCAEANTWTTASLVWGLAAPARLATTGLPARLVAADGTVQRIGGWPR